MMIPSSSPHLAAALLTGWLLLVASHAVGSTDPASTSPTLSAGESASPWKTFNARRAFSFLRRQTEFGPRVPGSPEAAQCLDWMESQFQGQGLSTRRQTFTAQVPLMQGRTITGTNLYAVVNAATETTRTVALSAHWDCRPVADMDPRPARRSEPVLGANDAASGVAVLLELAHVFRQHPPPVRVVFVCFDLEDAGRYSRDFEWCLGSQYAARHWPADLALAWGINLDMIGDRNLLIRQDVESLERAPDLQRAFWDLAVARFPQNFSRSMWPAIMDDHVPFLDRGIRYINVIDFDYPPWHTVEDTVDKCSPDSLRVVGEVTGEFIYRHSATPLGAR